MNLERKMARWAIAASAALVFVGIGASPASSQQTAVRLGYINSDIVLQQTPGYAQADSILRTERTAYQRELDALRGQLDSAIAAFDQQSLVLSPQAREAKLDEIRNLENKAVAIAKGGDFTESLDDQISALAEGVAGKSKKEEDSKIKAAEKALTQYDKEQAAAAAAG